MAADLFPFYSPYRYSLQLSSKLQLVPSEGILGFSGETPLL